MALMIHGVKGSIEPVLRTRPAAATAWVPLREIWNGIETEMQRVAEQRETVWMWRKVPVHAPATRKASARRLADLVRKRLELGSGSGRGGIDRHRSNALHHGDNPGPSGGLV